MIARSLLVLLAAGLAPAHAAEPDQVSMTLSEFLKLYEASKDRPEKPPKSPREYAVSSARYSGEVVTDDDEPTSAVFRGTMRVENLRGTWVRVPLLPASVAVRSARVGGQEAPLVLEGGQYVLVTEKTGAFDVELQFAVSVHTSQGSSGFAFQMVPAGATEVELAVPASEALDFTVANARLQEDRVVGGRRVVKATLPSQGSLSVTWQREIPEAEEQDPRLYAEVHTRVGIGEGILRADVTVYETILFAGVDRLQVDVPDGMTVLDVSGQGLRDWDVSDSGVLTAQLNYAAEGSYTLTVAMEQVVGSGQDIQVPLIRARGVEREKGFVGVQALGNLELTGGEVQGAAAVDVRTLPAGIIGVSGVPVLLGYKYLGAGASIPLTVTEHDEVDVLVTLLDQAEATTMFTQDGRRLTSVQYQVRNNRRQFLRLELPAEAELWSASVAGRSVQPAVGGSGELLVPLVRSEAAGGALAAFAVEVVYVESGAGPDSGGRGRFEADLPSADAPTTWVGWTVYAPWDAKVRTRSVDGSLRDVEYLSRPVATTEVMQVDALNAPMAQGAQQQVAGGALGEGAAPVKVSLPVDGQPLYFEKLLALDERLWVGFDYKGLK